MNFYMRFSTLPVVPAQSFMPSSKALAPSSPVASSKALAPSSPVAKFSTQNRTSRSPTQTSNHLPIISAAAAVCEIDDDIFYDLAEDFDSSQSSQANFYAASQSSDASSPSVGPADLRPVCHYDLNCYRLNAEHFRDCKHPVGLSQ